MSGYVEPAFPGQFTYGDGQTESWPGMSLRDYFAAQATDADVATMRGRVPTVTKVRDCGDGRKTLHHNAEPDEWHQIARYLHADAMLKARMALGAEVKP